MNELSNFYIKNPIGRGAGSFVCKIVHRQTLKEYAAKVIEKKSEESSLARLQNEVSLHMKLQNPNVVKLHQHLQDKDNHYLVMELCDHELYQFIKSKPQSKLTEQEVRYYGYQFVQGLDYLHQQNIIHRDLKLGNLLIKDDQLKIADFGLAIQLNDSEEERNTLCGTPNYISPEILNQQPYGKTVDLWSLGCCLYAMKQGRGPFETPNISLGDVLKKVQKGNFELPQAISSAFKDLLANLINLDAQSRYSTPKVLKHPFFRDTISESIPFKQDIIQQNQINPGHQKRVQSFCQPKSPNFAPNNEQSVFKFDQHNRDNSSSQLRQLVTCSPFGQTKGHRPSNSVASLTQTKMVTQFLQKQQELGGKKILFGQTTIGKQNHHQKYDTDNLPKFSLSKEVIQDENENSWLANKILKNFGLQEAQIKISPIKLRDVKPCKIQTKNGYFQIGEDGSFQMEITNKNLVFFVSEDGKTIKVTNKDQKQKVISIDKLPEKLQKFYQYSKQVCNAIREKSVKYRVENDLGQFQLRQGRKNLLFEVKFKNGIEMSHTLNDQKVTIRDQGQETEVELSDVKYQVQIKTMLKYLSQCLKDKCKT